LSFELYSNHDSPQDSTGTNGDWDYIPIGVYNWDTLYNEGEDIEAFAERRVKLLTKVQAFVRMWAIRRFAANVRRARWLMAQGALSDHPRFQEILGTTDNQVYWKLTRFQAIVRGRLARGGYRGYSFSFN
jgi:hypothetical protein